MGDPVVSRGTRIADYLPAPPLFVCLCFYRSVMSKCQRESTPGVGRSVTVDPKREEVISSLVMILRKYSKCCRFKFPNVSRMFGIHLFNLLCLGRAMHP